MKVTVLLVLIGSVMAFPQRPDRRPGRKLNRREREDPNVIIRCVAENPNDEANIQLCRDCFKAVSDLSTQEGLDEGKTCAEQYWPGQVAACPTEIAALVPGDKESMKNVMECLNEGLKTFKLETCLNEAEASDLEERLTEGSLCILDNWQFISSYLRNMTSRGGRIQGRRGNSLGGLLRRGKSRMMMKLMLSAHCEEANGEDDTKTESCVQCFTDAMTSSSPSRLEEADPDLISALTSCSQNHLSPMYDECTALMQEGTDMKPVHECKRKVLVGNYVSDCIEENSITTADTESLSTVMECGIENAFEWVADKSPRAAQMFENFMERFGGSDKDDEFGGDDENKDSSEEENESGGNDESEEDNSDEENEDSEEEFP